MTELRYTEIERQLVEALPELTPSATYYWTTEGAPGQDSGPYIFFESMFGTYVNVLLALPASSRRDELLSRAFGFAEAMLASRDREVQNLAFIGLFEGREAWWLARARQFIGPRGAHVMDTFDIGWRSRIEESAKTLPPEILDGYHVRSVVADELRRSGGFAGEVPGTTFATGPLPA